MVRKNMCWAPVEESTLQESSPVPGKSVEEKSDGDGDDDDDIIAQALRKAGIPSSSSPMPTSSPAVTPVQSVSVCTTANYKSPPSFCKHSPVNYQIGNANIPAVSGSSIRIMNVLSFTSPPPPPTQPSPPPHIPPRLPHSLATRYRKRGNPEQIAQHLSKYMRFSDVNPDTAASVAVAAVDTATATAAADAEAASKAAMKDGICLPRRRARRRAAVPSSQSS
ncbi:conserved hypothetical protein [Echinococcus multilocularis]|uniref:Uncharacterized protein n=1 Tax=Echinococcus multilocularis TaxID=6211 RepID=A0A068YBS5_ECHMU|nr:conserved hypothetical protein [Echinococcus multilocularis]